MRDSLVSFIWRDPQGVRRFRAGVCLHGHTMHSEECLSFLPRYLYRVPGAPQIVRRYQRGSGPVDFARALWTPPLSSASALRLERKQIAGLGLRPLVSLTDHDSIEAGMSLQVAVDTREVPISVEWTVPFERSILHLGVHNLPPHAARAWMGAMAAYTATPDDDRLPDLLSALARIPEVLIVLNHPFWLEEGVEEDDHSRALDRVLRDCLEWLHAFELNGTRSWPENAKVIELGRAYARPLISGGDRHACEPAACLNLTNAASFAEFADEIRGGLSAIWFMPHYREPIALRILETVRDILRPYPEYPNRVRWMDRVFYRSEPGAEAKPLSEVWQKHEPLLLRGVTGLVHGLASARLRGALRPLLAERGESLP